MTTYYRNPHGASPFPGIYEQGRLSWKYDDAVRTRLRRCGKIPGALASSLERITREAAVAQWRDNRSRWQRQPSPTVGGRDLARAIAIICFVAVSGMALAFFGSYLAVHEATGAYDTPAAIGAVGLGIGFCASGIWLIFAAERATRNLVRRVRGRATPADHSPES